jgi:GntR family transcriptional regulator
MILEGKTPYSKVLKKRLFTVDDSSTKVLHGMIGLNAMELIRLRFDGNIPIGIEYSITITERCQDIHTYDFSKQSLYNLLLYHYKLPVEEIHQSVGAVLSDQWHSELLKTNLNSPLLSITTTAFLENNELIETSNAFYRADKYEFKIRSKV